MLPVSLLIFSVSPFIMAGFIVILSDKKGHPVFSWMADDFSIIFIPNPKRDGVLHTNFLLFYHDFTRGAIR